MKKVTLKFKKEDFDRDYFDSDNCAITTALARAGYPDLKDGGGNITKDSSFKNISEEKSYQKMVKKVYGMYSFSSDKYPVDEWTIPVVAIEPKDFQVTILLDI